MPVADMAERADHAVEERLGADEAVIGQQIGAIGEMLAGAEADLEMERAVVAEQGARIDRPFVRHAQRRQQSLDQSRLARRAACGPWSGRRGGGWWSDRPWRCVEPPALLSLLRMRPATHASPRRPALRRLARVRRPARSCCRSTISPTDGPQPVARRRHTVRGAGDRRRRGSSCDREPLRHRRTARPAPVIGQAWIDEHQLRLDIVDANAEGRIVRLDARRRGGSDYRGILHPCAAGPGGCAAARTARRANRSRCASRSAAFWTLPIALRGRASAKRMRRGCLKRARSGDRRRARAASSSAGSAADDHRHHRLAEIGMRHADHRAFADAGDRVERELDLPGIDVEPAGDDQVLGPADDGDAAVRGHGRDVAGDEKAVGAHLLGGLSGWRQ